MVGGVRDADVRSGDADTRRRRRRCGCGRVPDVDLRQTIVRTLCPMHARRRAPVGSVWGRRHLLHWAWARSLAGANEAGLGGIGRWRRWPLWRTYGVVDLTEYRAPAADVVRGVNGAEATRDGADGRRCGKRADADAKELCTRMVYAGGVRNGGAVESLLRATPPLVDGVVEEEEAPLPHALTDVAAAVVRSPYWMSRRWCGGVVGVLDLV
ncbi:hypothetical protein B0H16DRAFT_1523486 [Mycena metata]|uniref:Uncharacterized protein n=1 Tax=Mycena metata TaxID=1033252 RepID=A0AAD7JMX8_9AGAR|nr:hypothetical protein B0H16DRAFT_1523486 [Mycena metata]